MKKLTKLAGIIAVLAIIGVGFSLAACELEKEEKADKLEDTMWSVTMTESGTRYLYLVRFSKDSKFDIRRRPMDDEWNYSTLVQGTYSISDGNVTLTPSTATYNFTLHGMYGTLSGNTLTFSSGSGNVVYTRTSSS